MLPTAVEAALDEPFLQILGDSGRGKSTILRGIAAHWKHFDCRVHLEYLAQGQRRFYSDMVNLDVFLLDEAQRLWLWQRRRLLSNATLNNVRIVLATHEDLTPLFRRSGLALSSVVLNQADNQQQVNRILTRRLSYFALRDGSELMFYPDAIAYLIQIYGSDLRGMQHFLYEVFQRLTPADRLNTPFLEKVANDLQAAK